MCVIFACHSATPDKETLALGASTNTDGAGIAWIHGRNSKHPLVTWKKGLPSTADAILDVIDKEKITYPFVIHYRTASIGGNAAELTHPFPVTDKQEDWLEGSTRRVLFHNGHIGGWEHWFKLIMFPASGIEIPIGPWSDSRALASAVNVKGEGVLDFIIDQSRVAILDAIPSIGWDKEDPKSYIRTFGKWLDKEGWYQSVEVRNKVIRVAEPDSWRKANRPVTQGVLCSSPTTDRNENTWTVDELETLIASLRKEQDEARIMLGV